MIRPWPLVIVLGPTGSGKSALALHLAERFSGEIVNCDSLQLYRGLDIATAKLPAAERRGIPHHLMDALNPDQVFSAGEYSRQARLALYDIRTRKKFPILAGGTGFYIQALLDGLVESPARDESTRAELTGREQRRPGFVHRLLRRLDSAAASRIHVNDVQKAVRAVEVALVSKRTLTARFGESEQPLEGFAVLKLGLAPDREALYARINDRCERMFSDGLVDEVRGVLAAGYPESAKALESIGCRQALDVLNGRCTVEEAIASTQMATRRYAKRQWTWFRRDPQANRDRRGPTSNQEPTLAPVSVVRESREVHWLTGFGNDTNVIEVSDCLVSEHIRNLNLFAEQIGPCPV